MNLVPFGERAPPTLDMPMGICVVSLLEPSTVARLNRPSPLIVTTAASLGNSTQAARPAGTRVVRSPSATISSVSSLSHTAVVRPEGDIAPIRLSGRRFSSPSCHSADCDSSGNEFSSYRIPVAAMVLPSSLTAKNSIGASRAITSLIVPVARSSRYTVPDSVPPTRILASGVPSTTVDWLTEIVEPLQLRGRRDNSVQGLYRLRLRTRPIGRIGQQKRRLQVCFRGCLGCGRELPCGRDERLFDGIVALNPGEDGQGTDNGQDHRETTDYPLQTAPLGSCNALRQVIGPDVDNAGDQLNPRRALAKSWPFGA